MSSSRREFIRKAGITGIGLASTGYYSNKLIFNKDVSQIIEKKNIFPDSKNLNVFDAHCVVGRHLNLRANGLHSAEDLISEMNHYAISEALVVDSLSREHHPKEGNDRIKKITVDQPRLHRAWSVLPSWIHETKQTPLDFLEEMKLHDIRAIFLYPNQYFFKLNDWNLDELLDLLSEYKVPVFINPINITGRAGTDASDWGPLIGSTDASDWDGIISLCKRWPKLPIIISENRIRRSQRLLYKTLDLCPNLHLEISAYWLHRGIEYLTEQWGANRLLFGSGWPRFGQHMTITNLTTAQISDGEKKMIAGDNLRKLISWNKLADILQVNFSETLDEYVEYGRSGIRPKDMKFYDVHGHLGKYRVDYHIPKSKIEEVVADIEYYGLKIVCVFSFAGVRSDEVYGNDIVSAAVNKYPEHLIGFTLLNPHRGEKEMLDELRRGQAMGMRGIKLHQAAQGYPADGDLIHVACQWAHEHNQIIINHNWPIGKAMEILVSTYPNACFVTAHTTTAYSDLMKKYPNLYVCSVPLLSPRACEEIVESIGADRLLFGSDLLDLPIGWGLGPILFARISSKEKKMILEENLNYILSNYSLPVN
jgi:predicted TIM-barrel fold metal-dependent hydrolase